MAPRKQWLSVLTDGLHGNEDFCNLSHLDVQFAVATLGVKVFWKHYRAPPQNRVAPYERGSGAMYPSDAEMIAGVQKHATAQNRLKPHSAVGPYNLYWCALEEKNYKQAHSYIEEAYNRIKNAPEGVVVDDVLTATTKIEYAGSLVWGKGEDAVVNYGLVRQLLNEFDKQCLKLKKWGMADFAHGECAMEETVRKFVDEQGAMIRRTPNAPDLDTMEITNPDGSKTINYCMVPSWKRSDHGLENHTDRGDESFLCGNCQKDAAVQKLNGGGKKCSACKLLL